MRLLLAAAVALLTACAGARRGDAPVADAPAICYAACTPSLTDTGVRWDVDAEDPAAWDALGADGGVTDQLTSKLLRCERARQACSGFLIDLKKRGVYRAAP